MRKSLKFFGAGLIVFFTSCHSAKKIVSDTVPTKKIATDTTAKKILIKDSGDIARAIFQDAKSYIPNYHTLSAKLSVSVKSNNLDQNVNASLRSRKDSLIWISLTGPFGIEGARAKISEDSAIIINKLNSSVEKRSITYLQNMIHQPLSYLDIQNILTGQLLISDGKLQSYKGNIDGSWILEIVKDNIQNTVIIDPIHKHLLENQLTDKNNRSRSCIITYRNFQSTIAGEIPTEIHIQIKDRVPLEVHLNYKQLNFNQILDYPFNIPTKYSVRQ